MGLGIGHHRSEAAGGNRALCHCTQGQGSVSMDGGHAGTTVLPPSLLLHHRCQHRQASHAVLPKAVGSGGGCPLLMPGCCGPYCTLCPVQRHVRCVTASRNSHMEGTVPAVGLCASGHPPAGHPLRHDPSGTRLSIYCAVLGLEHRQGASGPCHHHRHCQHQRQQRGAAATAMVVMTTGQPPRP